MVRTELQEIRYFAKDIVSDYTMLKMQQHIHHKKLSVFDHSLSVAVLSVKYANFLNKIFHIRFDKKSLIRGAMLHDYFLYDWHEPHHKFHGFTHPKIAYNNAINNFNVNKIEKDIIKKHMFPLTPFPPIKRESIIVCIADKVCAIREYLNKKAKYEY